MMKVTERLGGRIGTNGECFAPRPYEAIHGDASELRIPPKATQNWLVMFRLHGF